VSRYGALSLRRARNSSEKIQNISNGDPAMRNSVRIFALCLAGLCASAAAQMPAQTLSCYNNGAVVLTVTFTSAFFDVGASGYFTVFANVSQFNSLVTQVHYQEYFSYCQFSGDGQIIPSAVSLESLASNFGMNGNYTQLTFSYAGLQYPTGTPFVSRSATTGAAAKPTAKEKAKALAAFLARVPAPAAVAPAAVTAK
jgi:hypothetical protein